MGFAGGAIGAIGSAAASIGGSLIDADQGRRNADRQMQFQKRMSNTAHQREVRDLEAAGLNPLLSAKYGGSSTPPGAMPPPTNFASSAQSAAALAQQRTLMNEQIENIEADTEKKKSEKAYTDWLRTGKGEAEIGNINSLADLNKQQLDVFKQQISEMASRIDLNKVNTSNMNLENAVKEIATKFLIDHDYLIKSDEVGKNALVREVGDLIKSFIPGFNRPAQGSRDIIINNDSRPRRQPAKRPPREFDSLGRPWERDSRP